MTREEKNRAIAEWLGGFGPVPCPEGGCESYVCRKGYHPGKSIPDFFTDEAANALLLEKMKIGSQSVLLNWGEDDDLWECSFIPYERIAAHSKDRKTAICEAALRLIEKPKEPSE